MKLIQKMLLFLCIFFNSTLPIEQSLTPENTIICSDLDDVLIQKSLLLSGLAELRHIAGDHKKIILETKKSLPAKRSGSASGLTFILLYHGMRKPYLAPHVAWMVEKLEKSHCFIEGSEKIYRYLKDIKGYTIVYATNKDRISYDISAQAFGDTFTSLASKVFVAHPGNSAELITQLQAFADLPTTPASYKELLHKALTIQPIATILHAPGKKPEREYYEYVEQNIGKDKNIIFIDDRLDNIEGFNTLQSTSSTQRIGILFKSPEQLAQEFVNVGILSEIEDAALLQDIRYPGIWGKIKLFGKKLMSKFTTSATAQSL